MAAVDIAFTVSARIQLAALEREPLEIHRGDAAHPAPRRMRHRDRLCQIRFSEAPLRSRRICACDNGNRLHHRRYVLCDDGVAPGDERRYSDEETNAHALQK